MLRLLDPTAGKIEFAGEDITKADKGRMRQLRRELQMIFQDPYGSLNPRHTVGTIISAPFDIQNMKPEGGTKKATQELMARVGLNPEHFNRYPHEFSGGQRQRIGIARSLALGRSSSSATSRSPRSTCRSRPRSSTCSRTSRTSGSSPTSSSPTTCPSSGTSPTGSS